MQPLQATTCGVKIVELFAELGGKVNLIFEDNKNCRPVMKAD